MLSQLAEVSDREKVYADLSEVSGSEVSMHRVADYANPRPGLPYASYVAAAHRAGHLAIGYRTTSRDGHSTWYRLVLAPPKTVSVDFQPDDRLIVVAPR